MQLKASELAMNVNTQITLLLTSGFLPSEKLPIFINRGFIEEAERFNNPGYLVNVKGRQGERYKCSYR